MGASGGPDDRELDLVIDPDLADALRERPSARRVMTQQWVNLTFIHYPVEPDRVQRLLPAGLTVDTFPDDSGVEKAWIGLVPFEIKQLAFFRRVLVPTTSRFLETNVRTYVHREGKEPGVWFFSLDAESLLACRSARAWFGLPYWHAKLAYAEQGRRRLYSGSRFGRRQPHYRIEVELEDALPVPTVGSREFFLVERYLLYSVRRGLLRKGRIHHAPYSIQRAKLLGVSGDLVSESGLEVGEPASVLYSPGVSVEVFPLQ